MAEEEKRHRKLTEKAQAIFEEENCVKRQDVESVWENFEDIAVAFPHQDSIADLRGLEKAIEECNQDFAQRCEDYRTFLNRVNTTESQHLLADFEEHVKQCLDLIQKLNTKIKSKKRHILECTLAASPDVSSEQIVCPPMQSTPKKEDESKPLDDDQQQSKKDDSVTDFSKFLLRKEFLLSRFFAFDDKPESFASWKTTFQSVVTELKLTKHEEMDLLVKWLGPQSSKFAKCLRSTNVHSPENGVKVIWDRLEQRYGRPEMIESALKEKLRAFPNLTNKDNAKLFDLVDILLEIQSAMINPQCTTLLSYFNSSSGVGPITAKLPYSLQDKWANYASTYKKTNNVAYPPFAIFVTFMQDICETRNDPAFYGYISHSNVSKNVISRKVELSASSSTNSFGSDSNSVNRCPVHKARHSLNECHAFRNRPIDDRRKFLREKRICFHCCDSNTHLAKDCQSVVKCGMCGKGNHPTALHIDWSREQSQVVQHPDNPSLSLSGHNPQVVNQISSKCTAICGKSFESKSCGKTLLVDVFSKENPEKVRRVYAIVDDQSNKSLASPDLLDSLVLEGFESSCQYPLHTCSGKTFMAGRKAKGLYIRSIDGKYVFELPEVIECDSIPGDLEEVATPSIAQAHPHLQCIASCLPELDTNSNIGLLIGRDIPGVHRVLSQVIGEIGQPFAQQLPLGWALIGEVCLGKVHTPKSLNICKTSILADGRPTNFPLCDHGYIHDDLFHTSPDDNKVGLSVEDKEFLSLMKSEFKLDEMGYWSAPLPFRKPKVNMPNNLPHSLGRAKILDRSLQNNPTKKEHFETFMEKVLSSGAAEVATSEPEGECWYLPLFGVYHPKKPHQIRGVFDSSAVYEGVSLNSVLMSGPDLTNNLVGILTRFRQNSVAIVGDIEQMFYQFRVHKHHRDYLRFFWYAENRVGNPLIEYRMTAHVFGNSPSPAIATYGLRLAVANADDDVRSFVENEFYVDDGLISLPSEHEAIELMKHTQLTLKENGNIRLHKIVSNSKTVMQAFPTSDLGKDVKDLNFSKDSLPTQYSLGLRWNMQFDTFEFILPNDSRPYTKRGLLSTINSLFDPLGFLAPVTITGKIVLRQVVTPGTDWDTPLFENDRKLWKTWLDSLNSLENLQIPRMIVPCSIQGNDLCNLFLHIFSDASEVALASVAYLQVQTLDKSSLFGFVMGKARLAPLKGHSIPRLELCAAVLSTELAQFICNSLKISLSQCYYYTDSKVVLGYITNKTRRFYTYVANRIEKIHHLSNRSQWSFVKSDINPADIATRSLLPCKFLHSIQEWTKAPVWLSDVHDDREVYFPLVTPLEDKEIRPSCPPVSVNKTQVQLNPIEHYLCKFSTWDSLVRAFSLLKAFARGVKYIPREEVEAFLICAVQNEVYKDEIHDIKTLKNVSNRSKICKLDPYLDSEGLLRVGGRFKHASWSINDKNPIILPSNCHVSKLIVVHGHCQVHHQGRQFTEGQVRNLGFWITGVKRLVYSLLSKCVTCRRLRGKFQTQKMGDLPRERLTSCPPFTFVGLDCFGPWDIVSRRTRGGYANSKRWAILFCCMYSRAIHIELLEEMSTSSCINALRRFLSLRGKVDTFFSDRGTNFVGAAKELGVQSIFSENKVLSFARKSGITWKFNTPHSSHMGGVWERLIGMVRRILDNILFESRHQKLTHEILSTFMAEVTAIMNNRPLVPVSTDSEYPTILSPNTLLTQKFGEKQEDFSHLSLADMYVKQWKCVQILAEKFWKHWKRDYIQSLQSRQKWRQSKMNIQPGDVILLKETENHRNFWPLAFISEVYPGQDNLVRKVRVVIQRDGKRLDFVRPVSEIVFLFHPEQVD